jgi:phage gp29-like protein
LGKYPGGATDKEKLTLLRAVTEIGHNAAGIIPEGMSIEFQNAAQGTQVPFEAMLNRMDAAISKAIIGQTLTSGEGQHGTQALGSVHNDIRLDILASDAELLSETLTDQLIAPLALLNIPGADPQRLPRFVLEVPEPEDIKLMAEALPKLAAAGVQIGSDWTAHKLRIPKLDPGEEPLKGIAAKTDPADPAADPAKPDTKPPGKANTPAAKAALQQLSAMPAAAAQATSTEQRDALDDLADDATREWQPLMEPLVQPILAQLQAALARGDTLEQFAAQLTAEFTQSLNATALTEQLARAQFVATLAGTAELEI